MRWEKIKAKVSGGESETSTGPGKRWGHTCNSIKGGRFLYVFGGYGRHNRQTNQVHVFDTAQQTWSELVVRGTPPIPRDSHTCTTVGDNLYVFGGTDGKGPLKDLHIFDTSTHTWTTPSLRGEGPGAREGHSATSVGKRLFIFGGAGRTSSGSEIYYNDVYILNTETFVWKRAATRGTPPCERDSHSCTSWKNQIIVIGGEDINECYLSDVHILDADTLMWKELNTSGPMLPPRASHTTVAFGKNLFVFGGFTDGQNLFNDLHTLDVETGLWTKLMSTGDVPSRRFSVGGDCIHPMKHGVLAFISGCDENLEAIDDMYYLHTGFVQEELSRPERLSLKKQLKLKCQEQSLSVPDHDKALVSINPMRQPVSITAFSQPGRENIPLNLAAQTFDGKRTFQAKVTETFPRGGYTIETVIDGKPLRGILFAKMPTSLPTADNNINNSSRKRKTRTPRVDVSKLRAQTDGIHGQTEATPTPNCQNVAVPEPQTGVADATLPLPTDPMLFKDEETSILNEADTLSPNHDERKAANGEED